MPPPSCAPRSGTRQRKPARPQDVPKLPDHAASRTFFTWFVNRAAVAASLVCDWLRAAGNIRARIDTVFQQHAQARKLPL